MTAAASLPPATPVLPSPSRLRAALVLVLLVLAPLPALADRHQRLYAPQGVAVGGFDPVAYFVDGRALPGAPDIALRWRGVRWHFASAAHRAAFEADPKAYLPRFGGYCTLSVARGHPEAASPRHWTLIDGQLYMAASAAALAAVLADPQAILPAATANWPPLAAEMAAGRALGD